MNPTGRRAAKLNAYLQEFLLRDEPSVARQKTGVTAFFSETCRALTFLIALRSLRASAVRGSSGIIRFAHPSGRTELRALLRYAPFLQRLRGKHRG